MHTTCRESHTWDRSRLDLARAGTAARMTLSDWGTYKLPNKARLMRGFHPSYSSRPSRTSSPSLPTYRASARFDHTSTQRITVLTQTHRHGTWDMGHGTCWPVVEGTMPGSHREGCTCRRKEVQCNEGKNYCWKVPIWYCFEALLSILQSFLACSSLCLWIMCIRSISLVSPFCSYPPKPLTG
jgi:hypothetical protein